MNDQMTLEEYFADLFDEMIANAMDNCIGVVPYPTEENGEFQVAKPKADIAWADYCTQQR